MNINKLNKAVELVVVALSVILSIGSYIYYVFM